MLLKGVAVLASAPAWVGANVLPRVGVAYGATSGRWLHAVGDPRGSAIAVAVSRTREGRFGVMFKKLSAFAPADTLLSDLARAMVDPRSASIKNDPSDHDALDNLALPAGFTFFGQFLDHDMTRDTTPLTEAQADPHATTNFDTPFLDLGSLYGHGPAGSPELYDPAAPGTLRLSFPHGFPDLPRAADGTAFLGDPRNDENLIVAQLHAAFAQFHNRQIAAGKTFEQARQLTRWHFQWLVVNDFLPHVVGRELVDRLVVRRTDGTLTSAGTFYKPTNPLKPMMPIEFSVAAYRFAHSMVRPQYEMNDADVGVMFGPPEIDLRGHRVVPARFQADWTYFFDVPGTTVPAGRNFARLIDTKLSLPLHNLPAEILPNTPTMVNLAERNLLRGKRLGLPAGQDVAKAMSLTPLSNTQLGLTDPGWGGKAPLWFYMLKEAELVHGGRRLGPVGGRVVAEVILGVLALDTSSYFHAKPAFQPASADYRIGHLLRAAGVA